VETVSESLRRFVTARAEARWEYCLLPQAAALHTHEPDHIIPRQHGGSTDAGNLALACFRCNRYKGPNPGSLDPLTGERVRFYNPREQRWTEHFRLEDGVIEPLTPQGRVTAIILRLNDDARVTERRALIAAGLY